MGEEELKAATSDYLGLKSTEVAVTDDYGMMRDNKLVLAPVLKRTCGRSSMKQKRPATETGTTSSGGHACTLCTMKGHKKNNCHVG